MRRISLLSLAFVGAFTFAGCSDTVGPESAELVDATQYSVSDNACWGQATRVFAQMGEMGLHSSSQSNPRLGLPNLARELYDQGVIAEPTMQALGAFVASALGLSIDACM